MRKNGLNEKPYTTFVREYMAGFVAGEGMAEIAKRLDTTENTVSVYAAGLRKQGVALPRLNERLDVGHLNSMIRNAKKKVKKWA
jgi:transposase